MMNSFTATEMHTGGEPFRIIEHGYPEIKGNTILEKIKYLKSNLDYIRKMLMWEPRGHFDMFGVILVTPDNPRAEVGAIFLHNEGYSSMCGHGIISLGRYLVDKGMVKNPTIPETVVNVQCPCGLVETRVEYDGKKTGSVRFFSVPSFLYAKDVLVDVPDYGNVVVDIAFGGAFYAIVPASQYGLNKKTSIQLIKDAAGATTDALRKQLKIVHPESSDLAYLKGTIVTDGKDQYTEEVTANCCVFAEREVDRSPCGSGVTSRIAQQYGRNYLKLGQCRTFEGPTGSTFKAKLVREIKYGEYNAVVVEVSGKGYYTGHSTFSLEDNDDIGRGFLLT